MAVRQYIGARYVTKIYENTVTPGSAEWQASVNYEPLTLVTYNNGSYLSKKDVPASVGNPASNPDYWVQTGYYNGQIAYLQNQIDAINATLTTVNSDINQLIKPHRVVLITDSYGGVQSNEFPLALAATMGLTVNTDFFYHAEGGSGFIGNGVAPTFLAQFQSIENSISNIDFITDVVFCGGINDNSSTFADILAAIHTCISYVKAACIGARVHIGYISKSKDHNAIYGKYNNTLAAYHDGAMSYGGAFIDSSPFIMVYADLDTDGLHPTASGCRRLAWNISNYLNGSCESWLTTTGTLAGVFDQTDITTPGGATFNIKVSKYHNGNWFIQTGEILINTTNATGNFFQNGKKLASFTQGYIDNPDYDAGGIPITIFVRYNNGSDIWRAVPARLMIKLDGIYLKFHSDFEVNSYAMTALFFQPTNLTVDGLLV